MVRFDEENASSAAVGVRYRDGEPATFARKVKIFGVFEKTSNLNLRNSGADVALSANLLIS